MSRLTFFNKQDWAQGTRFVSMCMVTFERYSGTGTGIRQRTHSITLSLISKALEVIVHLGLSHIAFPEFVECSKCDILLMACFGIESNELYKASSPLEDVRTCFYMSLKKTARQTKAHLTFNPISGKSITLFKFSLRYTLINVTARCS